MKKSNYSVPKIIKFDDLKKSWYVYFRYDGVLLRFKKGINYIEKYNDRLKEIGYLRDALDEKLKSGWNPLIPEIEALEDDMFILDGLKFALDMKAGKISPKTKIAYTSTYNFFQAATLKLKLQNLKISEVKRVHVKTIFAKIKSDRNWSGKSYNKNIGYIKALFSELIEWDKIENNPAFSIKKLKVEQEEANIVATDEEGLKIKEHLLSVFPNFYYYMVTIFHVGIRPDELLGLKIGMIDLINNEIKIIASDSKNDKYRIVPINRYMHVYLSDLINEKTPKDYYLFGSNRENSNRGLKKELDFVPGIRRLKRDCASKLWRKLVKIELGLNINMYSMKHLGANKKIIAGMELDTLRELYGHSSKMMTMKYAKIVKSVYRKEIMENSPDF
jgi:integrase